MLSNKAFCHVWTLMFLFSISKLQCTASCVGWNLRNSDCTPLPLHMMNIDWGRRRGEQAVFVYGSCHEAPSCCCSSCSTSLSSEADLNQNSPHREPRTGVERDPAVHHLEVGDDMAPFDAERCSHTENNAAQNDETCQLQDQPTKAPILFPYGIQSFEQVRLHNLFYIDNTAAIRSLETMPAHIVLHRPPRSGKTLFLSMLLCYYDIGKKNDFQRLFKGLEIEKNPTGNQNSYYVLHINLGVAVDVQMTAEQTKQRITSKIHRDLSKFAAKYNFSLGVVDDHDLSGYLEEVVQQVNTRQGKLLVLIDEYDRIPNQIFFENRVAYYGVVAGRSGDPESSFLRGFFLDLKITLANVDCKSIVTGVSPVAFSDASGPNVWKDVSMNPALGDTFGFKKIDLCAALTAHGVDITQMEYPLSLMKRFYNGYTFRGSSESSYNPTLCINFLDSYFNEDGFREELNVNNPSHLMQDRNVFTNMNNVFSLLCQSSATPRICAKLLNADTPLTIDFLEQILHGRDLLNNQADPVKQERWIASFMFYHGILTLGSQTTPYQMQVPTELVRGLFWEQLERDLQVSQSDITLCFSNPTADSIQQLLQNIVDRQETIKDNCFSEGALQSEIESAMRAIQESKGGFTVRAERNVDENRYDLYVEVDGHIPVLLELKRVLPNAINYAGFNAEQRRKLPARTLAKFWHPNQFNAAKELLSGCSEESLRKLEILCVDPLWYMGSKTVDELERKAVDRCATYMKKVGGPVFGFTLIQVGWRLMVKYVGVENK